MSLVRNRERIHRAFEPLEPPSSGYADRALAAARAGVKRRRLAHTLRLTGQLVVGLAALALFLTLIVGGRLLKDGPLAHRANPAAPGADSASRYHQVVARDWRQLSTVYLAMDCRQTPLHGNQGQSNAPELPQDIAGCRSGLVQVRQAAQTMIADLHATTAPDTLTNSDLALKSALADLAMAIDNEVADLDRLDVGAYDADGTPVLLDFAAVRSAAVPLTKG